MLELKVEVTVQHDEETARLFRESTRLKNEGVIDEAIACLVTARARLLNSRGYPIETWCKLGRYLKDAGRYDEALAEFNFLLADSVRRTQHEFHVEDPSVSYGKNSKSKKQMALDLRRHQERYILWEIGRVHKKTVQAARKPTAGK